MKEGHILELEKFKELEEKIKNVLTEYSSLKKQNQELKELLKNKGLELEGATERLGELNEERDAIRTRLDSLINLLQDVDVNI